MDTNTEVKNDLPLDNNPSVSDDAFEAALKEIAGDANASLVETRGPRRDIGVTHD